MWAQRWSFPAPQFSLTRHPDTEFLLFGERSLIEVQLAKHPVMKAVSRVIHTDVAVGMNDKPSQALRRGRKTSSMWLAIDAVKKGDADVAISAGNTGALMAMADSVCACCPASTDRRSRRYGRRSAVIRSCSISAPPSAAMRIT